MSRLRVFTFNILTDRCVEDGPARFLSRSRLIADEFPAYGADLIGFQETMPPQRQWLVEHFPDYEVCGIGRDRDLSGESNVILFRRDRFDLCFLDTFWLSDTPRVPGSRFQTDQSHCPRICTTATLLDRPSGRRFRFYNTHLDHKGPNARFRGISLILDRIARDYAEDPLPVILTGDFNSEPDSAVRQAVLGFSGCGGPLRDVTEGVGITFNAFDPDEEGVKIDYIFTDLPCDASVSFTARNKRDGIPFSDHYPVCADIALESAARTDENNDLN